MLGPHDKSAFLALIPLLSHLSIPLWHFSDGCNPVTTGESMRIPGSTPTFPVIYRKCSHAKQSVHTKSSPLWTSKKKISIRSWVELHFTTILYILSFNYSYRYEINLIRKMYSTNSSVLDSKEKTVRTLYLETIFSECFWPTLFQTNRISRRIHKLSENLTSLSVFTLNMKQFLWKYHILPTLFWAALILLRSKPRKYLPWKVSSPEQNAVFCDCFASFKLYLKAEMFSFLPKYFVYRELKRAPQKYFFCFKCQNTGTVRILGNILYSITWYKQA